MSLYPEISGSMDFFKKRPIFISCGLAMVVILVPDASYAKWGRPATSFWPRRARHFLESRLLKPPGPQRGCPVVSGNGYRICWCSVIFPPLFIVLSIPALPIKTIEEPTFFPPCVSLCRLLRPVKIFFDVLVFRYPIIPVRSNRVSFLKFYCSSQSVTCSGDMVSTAFFI